MRKFIMPRIIKNKSDNRMGIEMKNPFYKMRIGWKVKLIGVLVLMGALLFLTYTAFFNIYNWVKTHEVIRQNPVIVRSPIIIKDVKTGKITSPLPSEKQIKELEKKMADDKRSALIERVYQYTRFLESRLGFDTTFDSTHVYCQSINGVNEIGYFPNGNRKFCFDNETEQRDTFVKWINKRLSEDMTMSEALCYYVTGKVQPTCLRAMELGL